MRSSDEFITQLNEKNESIQKLYLQNMSNLTKTAQIKVMLGDSTIISQKTFDPKLVSDYFQKIIKQLEGWSIQDVSISNNEDLRRIFIKFEMMEGNYMLSGHLSMQFHVLLYYKPIQRVIDSQKELADIINQTKNTEQQVSENSDQFVLDKLKEKGYKDFDHQKLFNVFYENDEFRENMYDEIQKDTGADFKKLSEKKAELLAELDSLLLETYQTSSALIDDAKLVTGEEGFLFTIDLEFVKNNNREGLFDAKKIPDTVKKNISKRIDEFKTIINF